MTDREKKELVKHTAMAICDLIDDIESSYRNTSLEQWKAFKRIRNQIRDKFIFQTGKGII